MKKKKKKKEEEEEEEGMGWVPWKALQIRLGKAESLK